MSVCSGALRVWIGDVTIPLRHAGNETRHPG